MTICKPTNLFDYTEAAKQIPIKGKRKPGRPKTTAAALKYQPTDEQSDEEAFSDDDDDISSEPVADVARNQRKKSIKMLICLRTFTFSKN